MFSPALRWWPPNKWPESSPDSLLDCCLQSLINKREGFLEVDEHTGLMSLKDGVTLPNQICEQLLELWFDRVNHDDNLEIDDNFLHIFENVQRTKLKSINLANSRVTDVGFEWVMRHKPREVNIDGCDKLTSAALDVIDRNSENLVALYIGDHVDLFMQPHDCYDDICPEQPPAKILFRCPQLQALTIHSQGLLELELMFFFQSLTVTLQNLASTLVHLDLSECEINHKPCVKSIGELTNLSSLVLYDVNLSHHVDHRVLFKQIKKLKKLRVLDLSQGKDQPVMYENPEETLGSLIQSLPNLTHLDLSGTNLAGFVPPRDESHSHRPQSQVPPDSDECAIPGLEGRHLEFLGLLNCPYQANTRPNIPANKIAGNANEEQTVLAVQKYTNKADLLLRALNNLFQLCRYSECTNQRVALHAIVRAMRKHQGRKTIQISGSASLFYICKSDDKHNFSSKVKRVIIRCLVDGMSNHMDETTMLRNGCLTLCHFKIPQDVLFEYERVVRLLLEIVRSEEQEEFVQHVGIFLLNSLACQVDGHEKQLVGEMGAIETMLYIIESRLLRGVCDEVMEIAWSTMWNVTDETSVNCERFIIGRGMELFVKCLQKFPDKDELLRNMMGLLGNVAEVAELRACLMESEYVDIFSNLLDSSSDGIEVSYNACGVLAHMVSDGPLAWTCEKPSRDTVLAKMINAISRWKLNTKRNINYRSFEPILRLLKKFETPEAQHWATWALCNLTMMYRKKYCELVEREQGVQLLEELASDPRPLPTTRQLAQHVIQRCRTYRTDGESSGDEDVDMEGEGEVMDDNE